MDKSNTNQNPYLSFNPWQERRDMEKAYKEGKLGPRTLD